eukprot:gene1948-1988_t
MSGKNKASNDKRFVADDDANAHPLPSLAGPIKLATSAQHEAYAPKTLIFRYVVKVNVLRPDPEDTIEINATVRKAVAAEINIGNPTDKPVEFVVRRRGEGLVGEDSIMLAPKQVDA